MQTPKKKLQKTILIAVVGMAAILGYLTLITFFRGDIELRIHLSNIVIPFFNMLAVLGLLYAAKNSKRWGKRVYLPWVFLLIGQLLYFMGDLNWAVLNTSISSQPFKSSANILYLLCYPFFALGILYFPRPASKQKKIRTILDIVIVSMSAALFLGVFLTMPGILKSTSNPLWMFLSVLYIIMGFILFYISYDLIFNKIQDLSDMILVLLILSLTLDVITNVVFYYFLLNNDYISGSFIDAGWLVSNLLVGLAGLIEGNKMKHSLPETPQLEDPKKFSWTSYVPLILVCASYIIINTKTGLSPTDLVLVNVGMGIIIFLVVIRQIMSMNENKQLYLDAQDEIEKRIETGKSLIAERERAEMYFNMAGTILIVLDLNGIVTRINRTGCEILGYTENEIKGKNWFENFLPMHGKKTSENIFNALITGNHDPCFENFETQILTKNRGELIVSWHRTVLKDVKGNVIGTLSSGEDVTEMVLRERKARKTAEQTIKRQEVLLELAKNDMHDLKGSLKQIIESASHVLNIDEVSIWFLSTDKTELECYDNYNLSNNSHNKGKKFKTENIPNYLVILKENLSLAVVDALNDSRIKELQVSLKPKGTTSLMDVPIWINGDVVGVMCHRNIEKRNWSFEDQDFAASISNMISTYLESSERKQAEEKIKESLKEKELLLREIHHRVKNNMQIISSLLSLQSSYLEDDEAVKTLEESRSRVKSMALIHEKLYKSNNLAKIDFTEYVKSLCSNLMYTYVEDPEKVKIKTEGDIINLNVDTSIPCGLIINELVTNSIKHAFPHGNGEINLKLDARQDDFSITVKDNGIGFPKDLDFENTKTLGLQLVTNLVNQIDGDIELCRDNGTKFEIKFKEVKYKARI